MTHDNTSDQSVNSSDKLFKLFDSLSAENKHINPSYIKITGSITSGYLLTQLVYLSKAYSYQPFYKVDSYMSSRYGFSRKELLCNRKKLSSLGFISTVRQQNPAKLFYSINVNNIIKALTDLQLINDDSDVTKGNNSIVTKGNNSDVTNCNNYTIKQLLINNNKERTNARAREARAPSRCTSLSISSGSANAFDEFWNLYPLKKNKVKAKQSYDKALSKITHQEIIEKLQLQLIERSQRADRGLFVAEVAHATTWLNQERWTDEVQTKDQIALEAKSKPKSASQSKALVNQEAQDMHQAYYQRMKARNESMTKGEIK